MIDVKVLRLDPDRVRASQRARGESESLVDDLVTADEARRNAIAHYEELRAEQKALGKQVAQADGEDRAILLSRTKELADMVKKAEAAQNEIAIAFDQMLRQVGNLVSEGVPPGGEDDYVVLETLGTPATSPPRASDPKIIWSSANCSARSMWNVGRRCLGPASTTSPAKAPNSSWP